MRDRTHEERHVDANSGPSEFRDPTSALHPKADSIQKLGHVRKVPILLQKSAVTAGCRSAIAKADRL
jgi:hypothetical protein